MQVADTKLFTQHTMAIHEIKQGDKQNVKYFLILAIIHQTGNQIIKKTKIFTPLETDQRITLKCMRAT